ncbi:MAG TPA: AI-2E family transporter, partial [Actinobacteria bacterium]|nr:AI-2E family transporter [Actinomycetota bacterium]
MTFVTKFAAAAGLRCRPAGRRARRRERRRHMYLPGSTGAVSWYYMGAGTHIHERSGQPMKVVIPRWVQMVALPLLVLLLWFSVGIFSQVVFIFLSAMLIAFTLNPLVTRLEKMKIPRYLGVLLVFLFFI